MPSTASDNDRRGGTGLLISFEGLDGVGKTTQIACVQQALQDGGRRCLRVREPGATPLGEAVRTLLLDKEDLDVSPTAELLLFEAARAQLVERVIRPALAQGAVVLCDRFCDSTLAYQGCGRGLGAPLTRAANGLACAGIAPDRTVLLDMDPTQACARARAQGQDRIERLEDDFHRRVRQGFLQLAHDEPGRVRVVDAQGSAAQVWSRVRDALADLIDLPRDMPAGGAL